MRLPSWVTRKPGALAASILAAAVGLGLLGTAEGTRAASVSLSASSAWLVSAGPGIVTLLDGAAEQVVGSLRVAPPKSDLSLVQSGTSAFVVDHDQGAVIRVDGATYDKLSSGPVAGGGPAPGLTVHPSAEELLVLDSERAVAVAVDRRSLRPQGPPMPLAAQSGEGQAALDDDGQLWLVDRDEGSLLQLRAHDEGEVRTVGPIDPGARIERVNGAAVAYDGKRVFRLQDGDGPRELDCEIPLRDGERGALAGSKSADRLQVAVAERGAVLLADLEATGNCLRTVQVADPGDDLGTPVEAEGHVLVPNLTRGEVALVDLATAQVAARLDVLPPAAALRLQSTNGAVFYNDLDSEKAGVIRFDGGLWQARPVAKYDPQRPGADLLPPPPPEPAGESGEPTTDEVEIPGPPLPGETQIVLPQTETTETQALPLDSGSPDPSGSSSPSSEPSDGNTELPAGPRVLRIVPPGIGNVQVSPIPEDAEEGTPEFCTRAESFCQWTYPGPREVTLTWTASPVPSPAPAWQGCTPLTTTTCTVNLSAPMTVVEAPAAGESYALNISFAGGEIDYRPNGVGPWTACSSPCTVAGVASVQLRARPATGSFLADWGQPGCPVSDLRCTVDLTGPESINPDFQVDSTDPTVSLKGTTVMGSGTVTPSSGNQPIDLFKTGVTLERTASDAGSGLRRQRTWVTYTFTCNTTPGGTMAAKVLATTDWSPLDDNTTACGAGEMMSASGRFWADAEDRTGNAVETDDLTWSWFRGA